LSAKREVKLSAVSKGLYSFVLQENDTIVIALADENHPVFMAHFEGNPILPGFLHIDITAEVFGLEVITVKSAKYFEIVRPSEQITIKRIKDGVYELSKEGMVVSKLELKA
jgi:3-hydroxyacyl-[acyl-carrier-protein] dehydratase